MGKSFKMLLSIVLAMVLLGMNVAHAESEEASEWTEDAEEQEETSFFEGLDVMEEMELALKVVRLEAVAGNKSIAEAHFKAALLFQNTSPYTIKNPATAIQVIDPVYNQIAIAYAKFEGSLPPGHTQALSVEFESLVELKPGQSVKKLKVMNYEALYGERIDDKSEITAKGAYVFIDNKQLKVKVSDPFGYQYVPVKNALEAAGYKYVWTAKTSTFTATKGKLKIEHKIGASTIKANGKVIKLTNRQSAIVNKTPVISIEVLPLIDTRFAIATGYHYDSEIVITSLADQELIK